MDITFYVMNHHTRNVDKVVSALEAQGVTPRVFTDTSDHCKSKDRTVKHLGVATNFLNILNDKCDTRWKVILHDDVDVPEQFVDVISHVLHYAPESQVSFYNPTNKAYRKAHEEGFNVLSTYANYWTQCLAFPTSKVEHFTNWVNEKVTHHGYYSEDGLLWRYNTRTKRKVYVIIPSIIQHLGYRESTFGNPPQCGKNLRNSATYSPKYDYKKVDWIKAFASPFKDSKKLSDGEYLKD